VAEVNDTVRGWDYSLYLEIMFPQLNGKVFQTPVNQPERICSEHYDEKVLILCQPQLKAPTMHTKRTAT